MRIWNQRIRGGCVGCGQAEDGRREGHVTGVQTGAIPSCWGAGKEAQKGKEGGGRGEGGGMKKREEVKR